MDIVTLELDSVSFFNMSLDESMFFLWLRSINSFMGLEGKGTTLFVTIDLNRTTFYEANCLLALFKRYEIKNREQLKVLTKNLKPKQKRLFNELLNL